MATAVFISYLGYYKVTKSIILFVDAGNCFINFIKHETILVSIEK